MLARISTLAVIAFLAASVPSFSSGSIASSDTVFNTQRHEAIKAHHAHHDGHHGHPLLQAAAATKETSLGSVPFHHPHPHHKQHKDHHYRKNRKLDDNDIQTDISSYTVVFEKCQSVLSYSAELAEQQNSKSVLKNTRFVVFRLCPTSSADSCHYDFGEYVVSMDLFLKYAVEYRQEEQEDMCDLCEEYCNDDGDGDRRRTLSVEEAFRGRKLAGNTVSDCNACTAACEAIENMQENGYVDASEYVECQQVREEGDDEPAYYAGAVCSDGGTGLTIGVFGDEECTYYEPDLAVEDFLVDDDGYAMKLDYGLLGRTYDNSDPVTCEAEDEDEDNNNNNNNGKETKEVCANVYEAAGKCENVHGFENGVDNAYSNYNNNNNNNNNNNEDENPYANQAQNEELVCDFLTALKSGTYEDDGTIYLKEGSAYQGGGGGGSHGSGSRYNTNPSPTTTQKITLSFLIVGTMGLAVYAVMLHSQLTKGGEKKPELASQGGALA